MKKLFSIAALASLWVLVGCDQKDASSGQTSSTPTPAQPTIVKAHNTAVKTVEISSINQAIQMFQVQEGRNPKTLDELVPKYIPKIPQPPTGMKYDYDEAAGSVKMVQE